MPDRAVGGMPTRDLSFALLYTPLLYRTLMLYSAGMLFVLRFRLQLPALCRTPAHRAS